MAARSALLLALVALSASTSALQVTPNSPCAALCIDSPDLDPSDPNSSSTRGEDIACDDGALRSSPRGQKFRRCVGCLQNSAFAQGGESDQAWFLYNLRYAFDYCILGYPNATGVGSNPCMTSEACGRLSDALEDGIKDLLGATERFDYCNADGGVVTGKYFDSCLQCVQAGSSHAYLSNSLVALGAGCQQKPAQGLILGLNDTVFSNTTIQATQPSSPSTSASAASNPSKPPLPIPAIAGIAVAGVVLLALVVGCIFVQLRKRRNRAARASALSFRCKTPRTGAFFTHSNEAGRHYDERDEEDYDEDRFFDEKPPHMDRSAASPGSQARPGPWAAQNSQAGLDLRQIKPASIVTNLPAPAPAHTSPRWSPGDEYTTPTSTTSTRSATGLLSHSPYMPTGSPGMLSSPVFTGSPAPDRSRSPPDSQETGLARNLVGHKGRSCAGTRVQSSKIQTSFAPPPRR